MDGISGMKSIGFFCVRNVNIIWILLLVLKRRETYFDILSYTISISNITLYNDCCEFQTHEYNNNNMHEYCMNTLKIYQKTGVSRNDDGNI